MIFIKKLFIVVAALLFFSFSVYVAWSVFILYEKPQAIIINPYLAYKYAPEVEELFAVKIQSLVELANDLELKSALQSSNEQTRSLSMGDILKQDQEWIKLGQDSDLVNRVLDSETSFRLKMFKDEQPVFVEIFVTNIIGLNVGATNMTTDFYQADEEWWINVYANGTGEMYRGNVEFDDSANTVVIPVYVPVFDSSEKVVIGVIKAVLSMELFKTEI